MGDGHGSTAADCILTASADRQDIDSTPVCDGCANETRIMLIDWAARIVDVDSGSLHLVHRHDSVLGKSSLACPNDGLVGGASVFEGHFDVLFANLRILYLTKRSGDTDSDDAGLHCALDIVGQVD